MQTIQQNLRKYRDEIKGAAILWVVFFHAQLGLDGLLYDVQKIGYGGVDIFLFLSGFGLYHSLRRNNDLKDYFRRRACRLLPAYWPFCLLWLAVMIPLANPGWRGALHMAAGNLLMFGYFSGAPYNINWYVSAMMASLLLAPALAAVLKEGKGYWLRAALLLACAFAAGLLFMGNAKYMAASRLPVFILGMIFAHPFQKEHRLSAAVLVGASVLGFAMLALFMQRWPDKLVTHALYWHPFVLITPGLCVFLGWLFSKCPAKMIAPLRLLGDASFEIFLFNVWVELLGKKFGLANGAFSWGIWSLISIAAGVLYHLTIRRACRKTNRLFSEKHEKKA